jgi:hypothetical protein
MHAHKVRELRFVFDESSKPLKNAILPDIINNDVRTGDAPIVNIVIKEAAKEGLWKITGMHL